MYRLDDVVLRALEKEPERRYQHVSQVRTAVDTIACAPARPPSGYAEAMGREILASDYALDIGSCMRRGWALVRSDFWPIVGVCALMLLLVQAATSTAIGIVAGGPLTGGLWLYLLKRARGEPSHLDTAFSGFRTAFLDLFLAGFLTLVLTVLGFFCLVLPGLYLAVAWMFALILVADQRLGFWPAMELSRKIVTKHWLKLFGFWIVLLLMNIAGLLVCGVGVFFTAPISLAATVFAYEDIFGPARKKAQEAAASVGPFGTSVPPGGAGNNAYRSGGFWKPAAIGLAAVFCLILLFRSIAVHRASRLAIEAEQTARQAVAQQLEVSNRLVSGSVIERVFEFTNDSHRALNLASGSFVSSTPDRPLDFSPGGAAALREAGVDFYLSEVEWSGYMSRAATGMNEAPKLNALNLRALGNLVSDEAGEPVNDLTNADYGVIDQSREQRETSDHRDQTLSGNKVFRVVTREGVRGLLQIDGVTEDPPGLKIRYKLLERGSGPGGSNRLSRESLRERIDAAGGIADVMGKSHAFARLATDAAKLGEMDLVTMSLRGISDVTMRDQAALESARLLARGHLRRQAIEIAKTISDRAIQDLALSELAQ